MIPSGSSAGKVNRHCSTLRTVAMTDSGQRTSLPQLSSGPLITGAVLVGTGAMLVLAGTSAWQNGKLAPEAAHQ
jgi:hypothetical protein